LYSQSEPVPPGPGDARVSPRELLGRFRCRGDGRLLAYLLTVQTAAQIAGPYFTPYMLHTLQFSYVEYAALIAVSFAVRIAVLPALGRLAHRCGPQTLLWIGGVGIVPMSGLWLFSDQFAYLVAVQVVAGLAWGAYELAMFLLFFETIDARERTSVLTTFNLANSLAMVAGSFLGAGLLAVWGKSAETYLALFGLSSLARAATIVLLARLPKVALEAQAIATRTVGLRATDGSLDEPILPSLAEPESR
jgi:MFS family permease